MLTKAPKGTRDILPGEIDKWHYFERIVREVVSRYAYKEVRFPLFEHTELFTRGVGESTDIVTKQMYTFEDKIGRSLTLRPEGTASAARVYIENKLYNQSQPIKMYYLGPMFRYERPQSGRYRQFHQLGIELFGTIAPEADVEVIKVAMDIFEELGMKSLSLEINSVGCPECRQDYQKELKEYLKQNVNSLCSDCKTRFEQNPLRILDCKNDMCNKIIEGDIPLLLDNLCYECYEHFEEVKKLLQIIGQDYKINSRMVRGLDYYTKTAFEIVVDELGAQSSIGGGGRFDGLVKECGGPDTPAVGFALGIERILLSMENQGIDIPGEEPVDFYLVFAGNEAKIECFKLLNKLRINGYSAEMEFNDKSLRAQFKKADKLNATYAIIVGDEELSEGTALLRNMTDGNQQKVHLENFLEDVTQLTV